MRRRRVFFILHDTEGIYMKISPCEWMGRRSLSLALFGLAWMIQGLALILTNAELTEAARDVPHEQIPHSVLGAIWIGTGAVGVLSGYFRRFRSTKPDTLGFLAVSTVPIFLAMSFLVSWISWATSGGTEGWRLGILGFAIWGDIVALIAVLASWPEVQSGGDDE